MIQNVKNWTLHLTQNINEWSAMVSGTICSTNLVRISSNNGSNTMLRIGL